VTNALDSLPEVIQPAKGDRDLLLAAVCLQFGSIDPDQFAALRKERPNGQLADVLVDRGWIKQADRPHFEYLANHYLRIHAGNCQAAVAQLLSNARRSVHALETLAPDSTIAYSPTSTTEELQLAEVGVASPATSRYTFRSVHAVGGMGRVWLGEDGQLKRDVALKELRPDHADNSKTAARFVREALLTAQLEHPGIVPVYELTSRAGTTQPFYAMRLVRGGTLSEAIRSYHSQRQIGQAGSLELVRLLTAFTAVCNTIAYAHSRGVIHRDLKGDNVILGDYGEVIVLDWGVAKHIDHNDEQPDSLVDFELARPGLTLQGEIIGTPAYMAPEQAEGRLSDIDERTDVYGLGAMLYEILTGKPPFVGERTIDVLQQAMRGSPKVPREHWPEVPTGLEEICLKAMAKEPERRFARADELGQAVQHWQDIQRRRAEDALRRQSEILKSILNSMSEGVVVSDHNGEVLLVNAAAERMLGLSGAAASLSQGGAKYFKPDGITQFDAEDFPLTRAMHGSEVDDVEMIVRSDKKTDGFWASANARPLRDEAGELRGGVVVFRDITERKQVENELIRSRERFELAVRGSQDGLWDWDPQTGEIYYSPQWKAILGYEDHEIGQRIEEWEQRLHPDDRERVIEANQAHIDGVTAHYQCEYRLRHKDGSYRWILARGVALRDSNGTAYRIAGSHVDITDRKNTERTERHLS
jgi:eukaryotic-like serine/threonine-protein kinase